LRQHQTNPDNSNGHHDDGDKDQACTVHGTLSRIVNSEASIVREACPQARLHAQCPIHDGQMVTC
jgi:hypothetical protein